MCSKFCIDSIAKYKVITIIMVCPPLHVLYIRSLNVYFYMLFKGLKSDNAVE